jgi:hypothetical protein
LERETYTAESIIFAVVGGFLDVVASHNRRFPVVIIAFICCEIDLSEELLLVVFEFSNHLVLVVVIILARLTLGGRNINYFSRTLSGRRNVFAALRN